MRGVELTLIFRYKSVKRIFYDEGNQNEENIERGDSRNMYRQPPDHIICEVVSTQMNETFRQLYQKIKCST